MANTLIEFKHLKLGVLAHAKIRKRALWQYYIKDSAVYMPHENTEFNSVEYAGGVWCPSIIQIKDCIPVTIQEVTVGEAETISYSVLCVDGLSKGCFILNNEENTHWSNAELLEGILVGGEIIEGINLYPEYILEMVK